MSVESLLVEDHPFYQGLHRGRLLYLRCETCARALPYGAGLCPRCPESTIGWEPSAGRGEVRARATYHRSYREDLPAPYNVVIVQLDEGPRLLGRLSVEAESIMAGARVRAQIDNDELLFVAE
jgi:uncharacterized OB-fold protein